jgi:hypothetical protein
MLAAALPLSAQVTITGDAGLNSQYQWRGITTTNRPVVQPDFIVAAPFGRLAVTAGAWASLEGGRYDDPQRHISENGGSRAGLAEYDLWLEAAFPVRRVTVTAGALTYAFPNTAGTTASSNTLEAYVKAKADAPFAPQVTVWYDVQKVHGAYAEVSVGRSVGAYALGAVTGWNFGQSAGDGGALGYFTRHGFTHADLSVSRSWTAGAVSVAPAMHVIVGGDAATWRASPMRDSHTKIWFGSTLTWSRTLRNQATAAGAGGGAAAATGQAPTGK